MWVSASRGGRPDPRWPPQRTPRGSALPFCGRSAAHRESARPGQEGPGPPGRARQCRQCPRRGPSSGPAFSQRADQAAQGRLR
eukprot:5443614-Alexandrium_andersonii.AAC.1